MISFHFLLPVALKNRTALKLYIEEMMKREGRKLHDLSFIFCSDDYLLTINRQFLQHDFYTDIISFDLTRPGVKELTGEVYISYDRVKENAANLGVPTQLELHRVIFHGVLHFCGYRDKKMQDVVEMRSKEDFYLSRYL